MKLYPLNALLSRMKYIPRWSLMRAVREENLCEHTADCAHIAHMLGLIAQKIYNKDVSAANMAIAALYHDASEILTGDMPTPVKYKSEELKKAYKTLEKNSAKQLCQCAPPEFSQELSDIFLQTNLTDYEKNLVKAADRLCALIKCIEEETSGNKEFLGAKKQQTNALKAMQCPEADYFIENMLPCYKKTLDELVEF